MTIRSALLSGVAIVAIAGGALAQTAETNADGTVILRPGEEAATDAEQAVEGAAEETAEAAEEAGDVLAEGAGELAAETEDAAEGVEADATEMMAEGEATEGEGGNTTTQMVPIETTDAPADGTAMPAEGAEAETADAPMTDGAATDTATTAPMAEGAAETDTAETETETVETETVVAEDAGGTYGIFGDRAVSDLVGMNVLARQADSEEMDDVGEIESLVRVSGDVMAVVGVGGFLGLGEHDVAIPLRDFEETEDGLILPEFTEEQLDAMAPYEGGAEELPLDVTVAGDAVAPAAPIGGDAPMSTTAPTVSQ